MCDLMGASFWGSNALNMKDGCQIPTSIISACKKSSQSLAKRNAISPLMFISGCLELPCHPACSLHCQASKCPGLGGVDLIGHLPQESFWRGFFLGTFILLCEWFPDQLKGTHVMSDPN